MVGYNNEEYFFGQWRFPCFFLDNMSETWTAAITKTQRLVLGKITGPDYIIKFNLLKKRDPFSEYFVPKTKMDIVQKKIVLLKQKNMDVHKHTKQSQSSNLSFASA